MADINDPIDLKLDVDGDIDITGAGAVFTTGLDAVAQGCLQAISLFRGEWFLDLERGIPFFTDIAGQKFNKDQILDIYRDELLDVQDVESVSDLTAEFDGITRKLTITFVVLTPWGETPPQTVEV